MAPSSTAGPSTIGTVMGKTFLFYKIHFWSLMLVIAVFFVPISFLQVGWLLIQWFNQSYHPIQNSPVGVETIFANLFGLYGCWWLWPIEIFAKTSVSLIVTTQVISILKQQKKGLWQTIRQGMNRFWPYLVLKIWYYVLFTLPLLFSIFWLLPFPFFIIFTIPFIPYLTSLWMVAVPVLLIEETGVENALKRGSRLLRNNLLRTYGFLFVLLIPIIVIEFVSISISFLIFGPAISYIVSVILSIILRPFITIASVFYYFDLHKRAARI